MRRATVIVLALAFVLLLTGSASAYTPVSVYGGTASQRATVQTELSSQPRLVEYVQSVWPGFYVCLNYGGHAWPGYMDVNKTYIGKALTDLVAHELGHMIQLAGDQPGGLPSIGDKWLALLTEHGYGPETWVWEIKAPWYGKKNPYENFAENLKRTYFSPYYTLQTTPNTVLDWFNRVEMAAFLKSVGVLP